MSPMDSTRLHFNDNAIGMVRPDQALYEKLTDDEAVHIDRAAALAKSLGVTTGTLGVTEPLVRYSRPVRHVAGIRMQRAWSSF